MPALQPSAGALAGMSAPARVRFADAQAELLRGGPGGQATHPGLGLGAGYYLRFVRNRHERGAGGPVLFVLDMGMDGATMEKMLACFGDWGGPTHVPIIYRSSARSPPGHAAIGRHLGSPRMAFLACQVPREMPAGGGSVSSIHTACFRQGLDMTALAQRQAPRRLGSFRRRPGGSRRLRTRSPLGECGLSTSFCSTSTTITTGGS